MAATRWIVTVLAGVLLVLTGCGEGESPTEPPSGWNASETRMWKEDVDTSEVFQNMESLTEMGIFEEEMTLSSGEINQEQFQRAIKKSIERLYRSNPTIVDSLFDEYATSELEDADLSGGVVKDGQLEAKLLNEYQKRAFEAINEHYRQPELDEGVSGIQYPDSLRTQEVTGEVLLQMHVDTTGSVDAVEVVESVHPTLDAIAMKAATETTWEPGYIQEDGEWTPIPGWGRAPVPFRLQ